jgi:hypothetical protein
MRSISQYLLIMVKYHNGSLPIHISQILTVQTLFTPKKMKDSIRYLQQKNTDMLND